MELNRFAFSFAVAFLIASPLQPVAAAEITVVKEYASGSTQDAFYLRSSDTGYPSFPSILGVFDDRIAISNTLNNGKQVVVDKNGNILSISKRIRASGSIVDKYQMKECSVGNVVAEQAGIWVRSNGAYALVKPDGSVSFAGSSRPVTAGTMHANEKILEYEDISIRVSNPEEWLYWQRSGMSVVALMGETIARFSLEKTDETIKNKPGYFLVQNGVWQIPEAEVTQTPVPYDLTKGAKIEVARQYQSPCFSASTEIFLIEGSSSKVKLIKLTLP